MTNNNNENFYLIPVTSFESKVRHFWHNHTQSLSTVDLMRSITSSQTSDATRYS